MNPDPFQRGNLYMSSEYRVLVFFFLTPYHFHWTALPLSVLSLLAANQKVQTSINQTTNKPTKTIHTKQWKHKSSHFLSFLYCPRKNKNSRKNRTSQTFTDRQETTMASHGNKSDEEAAISEAPNTPISTIVIIIGTQYYTIYVCVCWSIYFCFLLSGFWLFFAYVVLFMVISGGDQLCRQRRFLWWTGSSLLRTLTPCEFLVLSVFLFILFFFNFDDKVTSLGLRSQKSWESLLLLKSTCGEKEGFFFF